MQCIKYVNLPNNSTIGTLAERLRAGGAGFLLRSYAIVSIFYSERWEVLIFK